MSNMFLSKKFWGPCTAKDLEMKAITSTVKQKVNNRPRALWLWTSPPS
jgi:hypothetical protein